MQRRERMLLGRLPLGGHRDCETEPDGDAGGAVRTADRRRRWRTVRTPRPWLRRLLRGRERRSWLAAAFPTIDLEPLAWVGARAAADRRARAAAGRGLPRRLARGHRLLPRDALLGRLHDRHYTNVPAGRGLRRPAAHGVRSSRSTSAPSPPGCAGSSARRAAGALARAAALGGARVGARLRSSSAFRGATSATRSIANHDLVADGRGDRRLRRLGRARAVQRGDGRGAPSRRWRGGAAPRACRRWSRSRCWWSGLPLLGRWRADVLRTRPPAARSRVGLVQGNVEQDEKWDPAYQDETMTRYETLTRAAVAERRRRSSSGPRRRRRSSSRSRAPLRVAGPRPRRRSRTRISLFGSPAFSHDRDGDSAAVNRAYLVAPDGGPRSGCYDKMELVPFGEYVPFKWALLLRRQGGGRRSATSCRETPRPCFRLPDAPLRRR